MCGILALLRVRPQPSVPTAPVVAAAHRVRHRGPDDEGYLLWGSGEQPKVYAGPDTATETRDALRLPPLPDRAPWRVAFGHRRLSIVDLTPAGHQPMVHAPTGLAVCYNGEIYNHIELRSELERLGHAFHSHCDTEVLLAAWAQWGPTCLDRFNGMFSFVLLDPRGGGTLHAVRDRFGVKPMYWARVGDYIGFASEIKQLRSLPGFAPRLDLATTRDYLATGLLDFSRHTFDEQVQQLLGGERAVVRLDVAEPSLEISRWYDLQARPFSMSYEEAAAQFRDMLRDSVRLRLRADVPVGSCLSGGLDSSAIVCLAREALEEQGQHQGQVTVTARFESARYDEWQFAEQVIARTGATPVETWPSVERLQAELDAQLWYMDEPFGSTSQFSQWCVFAAAGDAGLKVMLDGQGSDEQLAGYNGNDGALLTGLVRRGALLPAAREALAFRRRHDVYPIAQLLFATRNAAPWMDAFLPGRLRVEQGNPPWLRLTGATHVSRRAPRDLNDSLREQTLVTSLPVLLRYEDRNSMARSIESRVPFLDYRFVEFLAGVPDTMKLREGLTKRLMRDAMRGVLPETVRDRRDKMGFVTPEQIWLTQTATEWFRAGLRTAVDQAPQFFDADQLFRMFDEMVAGRTAFSFEPWRILCLGRWMANGMGAEMPGGAASGALVAAS